MYRFLILLLLGLCMAFNAYASPQAYRLEDCIRYAMEHSPTLDSARRRKAVAEDQLSNAWAAFLPRLDLSSTHGWEGADPSVKSSPWAGSLGLSLSQDFYNNHQNWTQKKIRERQTELAKVELEKAEAALVLAVQEAFYELSLNNQLFAVQKDQQDLINKQFVSVSRQYQQGLKTQKDFLRFKSELRKSELRILNLTNRIQQAQADLKKTMGVPLERESEMNFESVKVEKLSKAAFPTGMPSIQTHFESELASLKNQVNEETVYLTERKYWPQVSLAGGVDYLNDDFYRRAGGFTNGDSLNWNIMLTLKFNLWDWGILRREVAIARNEQRIQKNQYDNDLLELRAELTKLMLDIEQQKESYDLSVELLDLEGKSFEVLEGDYRQGKVPFLDLVRGLETLNSAKINFYTVFFDSMKTISRYRYHERKPHAEQSIQ